MLKPLSVTVVELQDTAVIIADAEGSRFSLPLSAVVGKPTLNQPLFLVGATAQAESSSTHPLSQAIVEHLLESSS